jgi:hypothetical protein
MATVENCKNNEFKNNNWDACDREMNNYCRNNPNDLDLCGCSSNAFQRIPDPKMGMLNPRCWSQTCSTNPTAYRFKFNEDTCPTVCVDNSSINSFGSNIIDSKFKQSNCGNEDTDIDDTKPEDETMTTFALGAILLLVVLVILSSSSSLIILKS